ncbi:GGDEF domain-containing protein [uncultured Alteromonas sp.]|jgi:diguanylate cyclase (GGDEF)-like protein|uniref:GGDEF domain-containing protein n=1 Tax=uncultured Alteromonas sp. TaxID=179113 RepID=UPI0025CC7E09|nr:GGDEF domain-containing protein [uncultured Alteromonas sp.]
MDTLLSTSIELNKVNILLALLFSIGWIVIAKPLQLYHNSSIRFALANLLFALALLLDFRHPDNPTLFLWVIGDIILLISFIIYNLALRHLFRLTIDPKWFSSMILVVSAAYGLFLFGWITPESASLLALGMIIVVMIATLKMKFKALHEAFSANIAGILCLADVLIIVMVVSKITLWAVAVPIPQNSLFFSPYNASLMLWMQVVLVILINTTAVGTTISRLIVRMKYLADHDQLTGLLNRRAFQSQLEYQFSLFQRYQRPFSILMLDIDYFKMINDTFGHSAGDKAIVHTAKQLKQQVRQSDLVARFGGEEFIVLLADQSQSDAKLIADKICQTLSEAKWADAADPLTISIGCVEASQARDPDQLLKLADDALYQAKANGRNQAVMAGTKLNYLV